MVCTSGMAACTMVYLTYLRAGDHLLLFHDIYGAHYKVSLILERLGVDITWVDAADWRNLAKHIRPNTRMIFLETPSNPLCKVVDIRAVRKMADRVGALLVVDNTFATPFHQHPLELGAHLVVHSATKALGGHNDLMAGAIAGSKDDYDKLWFTRQAIGATIVGERATDLIHEPLLARAAELTVEDVADLIHAHPTIAEGAMEAARGLLARAVHV